MAHIAQWFHAASDITRLGLLEFLSARDRSVSELQTLIDVPQSTVSFHLKVLRDAGLVRERRDGRWKYFSLNGETFQRMVEFTQLVLPGAHAQESCPLTSCR
ncbi:MAG: ArsR/SmtB family transcription factor [Gemmatimonadales bacterium]